MKIVICDDEKSERQLLEKYVREWANGKATEVNFCCYESSESFLFSWAEDKNYDLLILDIEMGRMNGMELARKLRAEGAKMPILFATGYSEYMQYGYDVAALHYLLKPIQKEKIFAVLDRLETEPQKRKSLCLEAMDETIAIASEDIRYAEAVGHYCELHMSDSTIKLRESITSLEKKIGEESEFIKCHRSYLVNLQHVSSVRRAEVMLDGGESVPLSRNRVGQVNEAFIAYYRQKKG